MKDTNSRNAKKMLTLKAMELKELTAICAREVLNAKKVSSDAVNATTTDISHHALKKPVGTVFIAKTHMILEKLTRKFIWKDPDIHNICATNAEKPKNAVMDLKDATSVTMIFAWLAPRN